MSERLAWIHTPFTELVRLAWPIAVSMLSYTAMTMADTFFVSDIGPAALAGVGIAGMVFFTLMCFALGLLRAVKVLVSQAVGADRHGDIPVYLAAGMAMGLGFAVAIVAIAELGAPLLHGLAASPEAGEHAETYLRVRILGAPPFLVYVALREATYGQGDSRSPMNASVIANLANIGMDYLFVVHVGLGVAGVAWATVIACFLELGVLVHARWLDVRKLARPRMQHAAAIWRIGVPTGLQFLLEVGAFTVLTVMISSMSEVEMAAHQIVMQLMHVSFLPAHAAAEAASVMVGQAVGARRDDLVLGVARRAMLLAGGYTALCTVVSLGLASPILAGFTDDPALAATGAQLMYIGCIFLVADGANVVARGILRGAGDVRLPAVIGIASAWVLTPPMTWLLGYQLGLGVHGAWLALSLEIFAGAAVLWWRLLGGGWQRSAEASRDALAQAPAPEPA